MVITKCGNACDYLGIPGDTYCTKKSNRVSDKECLSCECNRAFKTADTSSRENVVVTTPQHSQRT